MQRKTKLYDEVRIVFDRYLNTSLKDQTREKRTKGVLPVRFQIADNMDITNISMTTLLSHKQTKNDLTLLFQKNIAKEAESNRKVVVCVAGTETRTNRPDLMDIAMLKHNHEEADTLISLHCLNAASSKPGCSIDVFTVDTDVYVLLIYIFSFLLPHCKLYMHAGKGKSSRVLDIEESCKKLGPRKCNALLGMHAFTGSDWGGKFSGITKRKWMKLFLELYDSDEILDALSYLGESLEDPNGEVIEALEKCGGRHIDHIADQLVVKIAEKIKNHMWVFVNCLIENPMFDSQTKENMTLLPKSFGSKCTMSEKYYKSVAGSGVVDSVMTWVKFKAQALLDKNCPGARKSKIKVDKHDPAELFNTAKSIECTLVLTEGDSAKTLVIAGLGVIGRARYGVYPLRGKLLNVREASHQQILKNKEIMDIIKIMGFQYKKKYESPEDLKSLNYGKIMIMTDQDQDGSHIKGLIINFIHHNWPNLLRMPFLEEFITPIVKVTKNKVSKPFYSLPEYEEWKSETPNWPTYNVKYYKGLGTSTSKEAQEYFSEINRHRIKFTYRSEDDDTSIRLAFSKKMIEQRKEWLGNSMMERKRRRELGLPEIYLYGKDCKSISYSDFVNKELILFSNADNIRSIPSLVDGMKPGQRKVMFTCFKRNDKKEIKVAQLAGSVAEHSSYHHGETSLMSTIINLAQNFVGSNNINLLQPIGQFGSRLTGGKDSASPRYISTLLSPLAQHIFNASDSPLLNNQYEDNQRIEPEYYVPILPMVLVNGADGIGTGWSTKIPNYDPREIIRNLKRLLAGDEPIPMNPWYKNFKGTIESIDNQRYICNGEVSVITANKIEITELPVKTWTQSYKEAVMEPMLHGVQPNKDKEKEKGTKAVKVPSIISDYKELHTDKTVKFVVTMPQDTLSKFEEDGMHRAFKLQTSMSTSSMVLFDADGCLKKYETVDEILQEFFTVRLEFYHKRKAYLDGMLSAEASKLDNQARFILEKISGKVVVENKKKKEIIRILEERGYDSDPVNVWKKAAFKEQDVRQARVTLRVTLTGLPLVLRLEGKGKKVQNGAGENQSPEYYLRLGKAISVLNHVGYSLTNRRANHYELGVMITILREKNQLLVIFTFIHMQLEKEKSAESGDEEEKTEGPDYDYLLNLSMWSLTEEKKDELIKKRDLKVAERDLMRGKTAADLWTENLDLFCVELDAIEQKEREELNYFKNLPKPTQGKGNARKKALHADVLPSPLGQRIVPRIDPELRRKAEKAAESKENKGKKKKEDKTQKKLDDVFKAMEQGEGQSQSLASRLGDTPDKIEKRKKSPVKKMKLTMDTSDESDDNFIIEEIQVQPKAERPKRAKAAKTLKIDSSGDEWGSDQSEPEAEPNVPSKDFSDQSDEEKVDDPPMSPIGGSDQGSDSDFLVASDDSFKPEPKRDIKPKEKAAPKPKKTLGPKTKTKAEKKQTTLFDSLISSGPSNDPPPPASEEKDDFDFHIEEPAKEPEKKAKVAPKKRTKPKSNDSDSDAPKLKKPAAKKKKKVFSDSEDDMFAEKPMKSKAAVDSDEDMFEPKPAKKAGGKKKKVISSDDEDDEEEYVPRARAAGRARAPVKYQFDDEDNDSD
ncbi:DNA topoisomerase 2-alpha [Nymphon striatum]|nr:DNA topoisomerase 2-alpha [Nymphon striatum]